jgi:amidase
MTRASGFSLIVLPLFLLLLSPRNGAAQDTHHFEPRRGYPTYAVREPELRIKPGDTVTTQTLACGCYTPANGQWPGDAGPILIEGATTSDTLVVTIQRLRLKIDSGESSTGSRGYGVLTPTNVTPMLTAPVPNRRFIWRLDRAALTATLDLPESHLPPATVDVSPMLGRLAVAPSGEQAIEGGVPGNFGGNMDSSDVREGTTVYLPIFHDGAYFYFGDAHALQGDGEITGSGIETQVDVTFHFDLIKGKKIAWPRYEDHDYLMVAGSARPLLDAFRIANVEMIRWLETDYGFERWEAVELFSQVSVQRIANVVDPNFTIVAKFPKKYLPRK